MEDIIATIETAIVNRLAYHNSTTKAKYKWAFKCKEIDGYGGQFDSAEEVAQAAQNAPGLWVSYEGETGEMAGNLYHVRLNFAVFALAKSYLPAELRRGGPNVVGLYQLIEAVRTALVNQSLGLNMNPLELQNITPLWRGGPQGGGISLALMRFQTRVSLAMEPNIDLDDIICPEPLYVAAWDLCGHYIVTDQFGPGAEVKP